MRRSECITAVMVLPAAIACEVNAAESASTGNAKPDLSNERLRRETWNILSFS